MQQEAQTQTLNGEEGGVQDSCGVQSNQRPDFKEIAEPQDLYDSDAEEKKTGQMSVTRLGTKEGRVISKNGFDINTRTFHLCCLCQGHCQGKDSSRARLPDGVHML